MAAGFISKTLSGLLASSARWVEFPDASQAPVHGAVTVDAGTGLPTTRAGGSAGAAGAVIPAVTSARAANGIVIAQDSFEKGDMCGFTHLWTPGSAPNCGSTFWLNRGGTPRIAVRANTQTGGEAMAIKRMLNLYGDGRYLQEMVISREALNLGSSYPRAYFPAGLDTALNNSDRRFYQVRYMQYDESAAAASGTWYLNMGAGYTAGVTVTGAAGGQFAPIPGTTGLTWETNENKAMPYKIEMEVDTANGRYLGFKFGHIGVGSLAASPDQSLYNLGVVASAPLTTYRGGVNSCFSVENRSSGTKTKGQMNCHFHRLTYLGA
ncbi:MAG: hypothetical protein JWR59_605 [Brevundimonas sp.]|nr:hypothetical protein [Brevundimonas sp.]